jgi:1,4-alpha-glucan branching enzyme
LSIDYGNAWFVINAAHGLVVPVTEPSRERFAMNATGEKNGNEFPAARHSVSPAHFYCQAPLAKSVELAGDFNHWKPFPMQLRGDGWWFLQVMLGPGHHQYRFLVDGKPVLDPRAMGVVRDPLNGEASVIAVG